MCNVNIHLWQQLFVIKYDFWKIWVSKESEESYAMSSMHFYARVVVTCVLVSRASLRPSGGVKGSFQEWHLIFIVLVCRMTYHRSMYRVIAQFHRFL
jgi:hypothetical protein